MRAALTLVFIVLTTSLQAQDQIIDDLLQSWDKHVEMSHLLLKGVKSEYLGDKSSSGGRNVGEHFAHMYNVRMLWMGQIDNEVFKTQDDVIDGKESLKFDYLAANLKKSDDLIRVTLERGLKNNLNFMGMTPVRFMAYLISHESHTRGQVMLALKQSGHEMPANIAYGIWEW